MIIAVDGPAASGKGTISKRIAETYSLPLLDTGLLYRAVGQRMRDLAFDLEDPWQAEQVALSFKVAWLEDPRLRMREASDAASRVAKFPALRTALRQFQQDFAALPGGAVLDGRDIGTVIAPNADAKLWIDADVGVRAHRRFLELNARGEQISEAHVLADLAARDARDAPNMVIAPDGIRIDTTQLDVDESVAAALKAVRCCLSRGGSPFAGRPG